jgi:prepilin-type N-terminal cleavage/methylation domain-containing protein
MTRRSPIGRQAVRRASSAGVTLLELLIVMSIMAIGAAIVIPLIGGGVSNSELKGAARQVAAGLRLAHRAS